MKNSSFLLRRFNIILNFNFISLSYHISKSLLLGNRLLEIRLDDLLVDLFSMDNGSNRTEPIWLIAELYRLYIMDFKLWVRDSLIWLRVQSELFINFHFNWAQLELFVWRVSTSLALRKVKWVFSTFIQVGIRPFLFLHEFHQWVSRFVQTFLLNQRTDLSSLILLSENITIDHI